MAASSSDRYEVTCPTCNFASSVANGTRRTVCPKCGAFYSREAAENPEPRRLVRRNQKEKESTTRRGIQSIANFFNSLTPNYTSSKSKHGFTSLIKTPELDNSCTSDDRSTEFPPIDNQGRLTVLNATPANSLEVKSLSRNANVSPKPALSVLSSVGSRTDNLEKTGAGISHTSHCSDERAVYPLRTKTSEQLREDILLARETGDWKDVHEFYCTTFVSFVEINAAFKRDPHKEYKSTDDPGLEFDFINSVYDLILGLSQEIQKTVLQSIYNCLMIDRKNHGRMRWPHSKDDLRAYLVLLQNPQFGHLSTYGILARLLRQIAALTDHEHHYFVYWLRKLSSDRFKMVIERLNSFISKRLFPPKPEDLPEMSECAWWIPSCTKVLALLNAANNLCQVPLVSHMEFYNMSLDHYDLMQEYFNWQDPNSPGGFSFCQYPFILSITAKRSILQHDSEQQMIIMARRSLVAKVQRRQLPDVGMLFFNLTVRREHLVSDSLHEIAEKHYELKKKLRVTFAGEPGLDMGGLTKEWFMLLIKKIFHENYGMFTYNKMASVYWFSTMPREDYQEFNLVGVLMGLAVYNSIILDLRLPPCCYKKLLSPPVVPFTNTQVPVGVCPLTLNDLKTVQPDVARGLQDLLDYDGDVEEDFCMNFQVCQDHCGHIKTLELKQGGIHIPVTRENRKEYVDLYIDWVLNKSVYQQFKAFYHGFHTVCASNALIMLRPEEIDMLVCGNPKLDMKELKKVTTYDGYHHLDPVIKNFWDVILGMSNSLQKDFLLFVTGSDRVPIGGMAEMTFKISRIESTTLLPMSHTCFNQLVLPPYKTKKQMKSRLILAIQNAEGFGME